MKIYRKKPVEVQAVQWNGENVGEVLEFCSEASFKSAGRINKKDDSIFIDTLEGTMEAKKGDYIIKGVKGEFYPCKPDIFEATYEEVSE